MVQFESINVCDEIKNVLRKFNINFVFQPIFDRANEVVAYEALMRPEGCSVLDFIDQMAEQDRLHEMELATFFGATIEYRKRGYNSKLCINSFPSECFTIKEAKEYSDCFKPIRDKLVIEILEYTSNESWKWRTKKRHTKVYEGIQVSLDDFGSGNNDLAAVEYYKPNTVKLDRTLIADIDKHEDKRNQVEEYINIFHEKGIEVLAEGVETEEEWKCLHQLGVDLFQGFYLARPA